MRLIFWFTSLFEIAITIHKKRFAFEKKKTVCCSNLLAYLQFLLEERTSSKRKHICFPNCQSETTSRSKVFKESKKKVSRKNSAEK